VCRITLTGAAHVFRHRLGSTPTQAGKLQEWAKVCAKIFWREFSIVEVAEQPTEIRGNGEYLGAQADSLASG
jgi:hypothetical protein